MSFHHPPIDSMDLSGQGQGFQQAKEICSGPKLRIPLSSPERVSPHLHTSGQLLSVDMPAQDLVKVTVSGVTNTFTNTLSTHLTLHPQMGVTVCLTLLQKVTELCCSPVRDFCDQACKAPPTLRACCGETQVQPLSLPTRPQTLTDRPITASSAPPVPR